MLWSLLSAAVPEVAAGDPLPPCPNDPNCICSEAGAPEGRRVDPFPLSATDGPGDPAAAWGAFKRAVGAIGGTIETDEKFTLHAVVRTPVLRFPDDLHARLDGGAGVIHVRSASRVGRKDFGANRRRAEKLRAAYLRELGG